MRIVVERDLLDIASRLREVDSTYFVVYDATTARYEVHSDSQYGSSLCFVVPYDRLDARTVVYAMQTSRHRSDALLRQIESDNRTLEVRENRQIIDRAMDSMDRLAGGANGTI